MGVLLLGAAAPISAQVPPGYEIIQITDDVHYNQGRRINNCGQVVFTTRFGADWTNAEVFVWDESGVTQITNDAVRNILPDMNDFGTIVWNRKTGANETYEIAMYRDGRITPLTNDAVDDTGASINNLDHVAWTRSAYEDCNSGDILFHDGSKVQMIAMDEFSNQSPRLNNRGAIVWTQYDFCVSPFLSTVMLYNSDKTIPLTDGISQAQGPQINDSWDVTWSAGATIWLSRAGTVLPIAESAVSPRINNRGTVLYSRWDGTFYQGWVYDDGVYLQVSDFSHPQGALARSINDHGEILMEAGMFPVSDLYVIRPLLRLPDADLDDDVDLADLAMQQHCFVTWQCNENPICSFFDMDRNGSINLEDTFNSLNQLTGPVR